MEQWSYKRNGAVEGPVSEDQLRSLYDSGEITRQTLVRSSFAGGGWRRFEDVADLRSLGSAPRIPGAVKKFWPWFVFGTPLVGGLIDVFLVQSKGNEFVASNAWLAHAPLGVNILALLLWFYLIWDDIRKRVQKNKAMEMIIWIVAAPVYQSFVWWGTALVASVINYSFGFELPQCQSDVAIAQVESQFAKAAAKKGDAGSSAVALTNTHEEWVADRFRLCTGQLVTPAKQSYPVRYRIEDRGNNLFRNTMHGLNISVLLE